MISGEVTRVTKEVISPIQMDAAVYAVLCGVAGLQWSERPMIINNASFSFGKQEILWDTMSFVNHVDTSFAKILLLTVLVRYTDQSIRYLDLYCNLQ